MSTKIRTSNLHTEVIQAFSSSTDSASIQAMIDSNLNNDITFGGDVTFDSDGAVFFDQSDKSLKFADNYRAKFGTGNDLNIYHSGGNSIIRENNGVPLYLQTNNVNQGVIITKKNAAETMAKFKADGAVELYHNNVKKFETTAYGADVTGTINADSSTINLLNVTQGGGANAMQVKNIYGAGLQIGGNWVRLMSTDFSADMGVFKPGAEVELYHNGSQKFETTSTGVDVTGDINLSGKVVGGGMVLLQETTFTSNTSSVTFDVFDESKYGHYVFYWICNHAPSWNRTYLRFRNSSGDIASTDYYNNTSWKNNAHGTAPTHNSSSYAGNQSYVWLAGNGTAYSSHGYGFISLFADGTSRALIRGLSQLANRSGSDHYEENWASTLHTTNPHSNLTGFKIFGAGGNSSFGRFTVFGVERA